MASVNSKERIQFMTRASDVTADMDRALFKMHEEFRDLAKKMNVSSIFLSSNKIAEAYDVVNENTRKMHDNLIEMLDIFAKDKYNTGEYKDIVKPALTKISDNKPQANETEKLELSSNAEEDVTPATIDGLNDLLGKLSKNALNYTHELSNVAGKLKTEDDTHMASAIGGSIEKINNGVSALLQKLVVSINEFQQDYKISLDNLATLSQGFKKVEEIDTNADIKMEI